MNTTPSARRIATPTELAFSCMFGLPPWLAHLLATMSEGAPVLTLRTHIHRLRAALPAEAVDRGEQGYYLTEVGLAECRQAIADFRAWVSSEERAA